MKFFKHSDILDPQHLDTPEKILMYFPVGSKIREIYNTEEYTVVACRRSCSGRLCFDCRSDGHVLDIADDSHRIKVACMYTKSGNLAYRRIVCGI